ncbi:PID-CTERM protein-sorting domain-containing protein [Parafilimonas sp.]|uniref:PID-CTERM protein-sorting domain-containing protein n=1 Tax=Parafilimonas sp. TaxID=1969739 RepID=UPI0039E68DC8
MKVLKPVAVLLLCTAPFFALTAKAGSQQDCDPKAPIDGGISLLIAAGAAFGAKSVFNKGSKKNNESEA